MVVSYINIYFRPLLVSIWAKILAVDTSCQTDLIRDSSHKYFLSVLQDDCMMPSHRTWAAFILASIVHNYKQGKNCQYNDLYEVFLNLSSSGMILPLREMIISI